MTGHSAMTDVYNNLPQHVVDLISVNSFQEYLTHTVRTRCQSGDPRWANYGAVVVVVVLFCSVLFLGRLLGLVLVVCVCVFWDEALKEADCESAVAEHARLIGFG